MVNIKRPTQVQAVALEPEFTIYGVQAMQVIDPHSKDLWITAIINGRWVQAKVYDEPSTYGINNGRVSKCFIGKTDTRDPNPNADFFSQMDFSYDRGLDFNNLPDEILDSIISELEKLPKLYS